MAIIYTDTFTAANGTLLSAHTSDTAQTYTAAPADFEIQSNGLVSTSASTVFAEVDQVLAYTTDYAVDFDLIVEAGATANNGMAVSLISSTNSVYWCRFSPTTNEVQLYKTASGNVSTKIGFWDYGAWVGPITINLRVYINAAGLTVEVDGVERIVSSDTTLSRSGEIGYRFGGNTGVTLDNASFDADPTATSSPTITNVNTTNVVQVGDVYNVTGTNFLATAGSQTFGGQSITATTWADTSLANPAFVRGDLNYANHDWIVADNLAVASAAVSVQLAIEAGYQVVTLSSPIIALVGGYRTSLCYGSVPDCVTGDQLRGPTTTDQGNALTLNVDGTFSIAAAGNTEQTFSFEIWDANAATNDKWAASTAVVVNGVIVGGNGIVSSIASSIVSNIVSNV